MILAAIEPDQSVTKAWSRALALTGPIRNNPHRVLPAVIEELGREFGDAPALLSDRESFTYRALSERSNKYARWALAQGVAKGDAVCLFMPNRPEFMAIWLGVTAVGGVVSLLNTNLSGVLLAHSISIVAPRHIIVASELIDPLISALPQVAGATQIWIYGAAHEQFARLDRDIERYPGDELRDTDRRATIEDGALYIYTSGTTGSPKAARVSHYRLMQTSHWFAGMMGSRSDDRMYNCLPMYHIVGGVQATGAVLVCGGSVVIREKFSASQFWNDVVRWDCTLFQYIGELCRYLLQTEPQSGEKEHRIRMCCGNGLRPDIWDEFKSRFGIPRIFEFYGATEGSVSLFNLEGKPGAIGRVPPFLAHRSPVTIVKFDVEAGEPVRNDQGFCTRCDPNEVGEAIGRLSEDSSSAGGRFEGYTDEDASKKRVLRDVFESGDAWFRTGDLMRRDERGYFYFVDRVGDTFRWKGENVATSDVAEVLSAFPGVKQVNVYGVAITGTEGRAGMATLVTDDEFDLAAFRAHLVHQLPTFARPLFLRLQNRMEVTPTFKHTKSRLMREGYDPGLTTDIILLDDPERQAFVRVDKPLYTRINAGAIRF